MSPGDTEALVGRKHTELLPEERLVERDVDEPRPGHLEGRFSTEVGGGDHVVSHIARLATELFGEGERTVGLRVGAITRAHHRIDRLIGTGNAGKRRGQQLGDDDEGISHEGSIVLVPVHSANFGFSRPGWPRTTGLRRCVAILADIPPS